MNVLLAGQHPLLSQNSGSNGFPFKKHRFMQHAFTVSPAGSKLRKFGFQHMREHNGKHFYYISPWVSNLFLI